MDIKILDSHLREFLKTDATPKTFAEKMSLASVSIERIEPRGDDFVYDIEVTTNRPDLASVVGLAREASAVLPQAGIDATFEPPKLLDIGGKSQEDFIRIHNDDKYIYRVCGAVMDVTVKESPQYIQDCLEAEGIRSLNNLIDVTNYVMRTIGHPTHVFDYDRLNAHTLVLRESKKGETITTLDGKTYTLPGGDLVADNGKEIVDLLGIMGLENSVVTDKTKRILFFIDNNDPLKMRKTSMTLGVRTEAAQLNEKNIDPYLAGDALAYGIRLFEEIADGKLLQTFDIFPNPPKPKTITLPNSKISEIIGIPIPIGTSERILKNLGFHTIVSNDVITTTPPFSRMKDIHIPEDIVEEVARIYGYQNVPVKLPPLEGIQPAHFGQGIFFWEQRVKNMMKYLGFIEIYTYSMVSENLYEGPVNDAVTVKNYLTEDLAYMRRTLVPSLLQVIEENKAREHVRIFEIANVYKKHDPKLPIETRMLAGIVKRPNVTFFHVKGLIEQILTDCGITDYAFTLAEGSSGAEIYIGTQRIGDIEVLDQDMIDFELDFEIVVEHATLKKNYIPASKYPPIIEDLAFVIDEKYPTADVIAAIKKQSPLIQEVSLLDRYKDSRTFHVIYQDEKKNLTNEDATEIRKKIVAALQKEFSSKLKE